VFVIKNALLSIVRSKGRTILIGLIVAVIATASCIALSIRDAAKSAASTQLADTTITGTIQMDRSALMGAQPSAQPSSGSTAAPDREEMRKALAGADDLTLAQMQALANNSNVQSLRYSATTSVDVTGSLEAVSTSSSSTSSASPSATSSSGSGSDQRDPGQGGDMPGRDFGGMASGDLSLVAYSDEASMTEFVAGTSKVTSGTVFDFNSADNKVLVSQEFATYNSLSVGDTITVSNPAATSETYTLTISGIYTTSDSSSTQMQFSTAQDPANAICVSYPTLAAIISNSASVATTTTDTNGDSVSTALTDRVSATLVFANEDAYNAYNSALPGLLSAQNLSSDYKLSSQDLSNYESSVTPLNNLSKFATTLFWIVLGVGAIVLVGIAIFNIRERKYEVGVLTAIGVKKPKVALQFVAESLVISLIAIVIGLGIGAATSPKIADSLLASQISQMTTQTTTTNQNFGRGPDGQAPGAAPGGTSTSGTSGSGSSGQGFGGFSGPGNMVQGLEKSTNYVDKISATINPKIIGELFAIGIALSVVASMAGVIFVMRYEPLRILSDRA
jgi:putative ABC transport system permease protein